MWGSNSFEKGLGGRGDRLSRQFTVFLVLVLTHAATAQVRVPVIRAGDDVEGLSSVSGQAIEIVRSGPDDPIRLALGMESFSIHVWDVSSPTSISEWEEPIYGGVVPGVGSFGRAIASLPDYDGDGMPEIAVGAPTEGPDELGAVTIRSLKSGLAILPTRRTLQPPHLDESARFGAAICAVESIDPDNVMDLVVGAPGMDAIYLIYPDSSGEAKGYQRLPLGGLSVRGTAFGSSIASLNDLDQNGLPEIAVGAPNTPNGGAVYVGFLEQGDSVQVSHWAEIKGPTGAPGTGVEIGDRFGASLSLGPDLDRDGIHDLLVGTPGDDDGGTDRGAVWVVLLKNDGTAKGYQKLSHTTNAVTGSLRNGYRFGAAVEWLGDFDGDGFDDLAVVVPGLESVWFLYGLPAYPRGSPLNIRQEPLKPETGESVTIVGHWGNAVEEAVLRFQPAGGQHLFGQSMVQGMQPSEMRGEIPSTFLGPRGTEYAVELRFMDGTRTRSPEEGFHSFPVRVADGVSIRVEGGSEISSYRLISVPLVLEASDARAILRSTFGAIDPTEWRFFGQDMTTNQVLELGDREFELAPGRAFWLASAGETLIETGAGSTVPTSPPFRMKLRTGWNLVGNPYNFDYPITRLRLDSESPVDVRAFDGSWYESDSLHALEGYAVWSSADDTLEFDVNSVDGAEGVAASIPEWKIRIDAISPSASDTKNLAAVFREAWQGRDRHDKPEPPAMGARIRAFFEGLDWGRVASGTEIDARPSGQQGYDWALTVETIDQEYVDLRFSGLESLPVSFEAHLVDQATSQRTNLREVNNLRLYTPGQRESRHLRLSVGRGEVVQTIDPNSDESLSIYPNPFRDKLTISYSLTAGSPASLGVYDVLGRVILDFPVEPTTTRGNSVSWDGRTLSGGQAAPGLYIVRLETAKRRLSKSAFYAH